MFKIFRVSVENREFGLSQTVDLGFSLSTLFLSLLSLSPLALPSLCARRHLNAAARALAALLPRARCAAAVLADLLLRTASPRSSAHAPGRRSLPPARTAPSPPEPPRHYCPVAQPRHPALVPVVDPAPRSSARLPSLCHARVPALCDDDDGDRKSVV